VSDGRATTERIRLEPADSFDLIRLLARSQSDARKAVAELVQNSLDAGARRIEVIWFNEDGQRALRVVDDGEGIFPDLDRPAALRRLASTIGHSHKKSLTPARRRELMMLGKYGIGMLGFWAVGEEMQICSRVGGGETWRLLLLEDDPSGAIVRLPRRRLDEAETRTTITIRNLHEGALRQLRPAKLEAYLASELRGQLLRREVELVIFDRVARGRARKRFLVEPERFRGQRFDDLSQLEVPGHEAAQLELYLVPPDLDPPGRVTLACGGATVLDDLSHLDGPDSRRLPWVSGRLEGVIDYPDLQVPPGSRRGFIRDEAALVFLAALEQLEILLAQRIEEDDRQRQEALHESLAKEIRKAFVSVAATLPEYDLFDVEAGRRDGDGNGAGDGAALGGESLESEAHEPLLDRSDGEAPNAELFPPGPLARVQLEPSSTQMATATRRRFRAVPVDIAGRRILAPVTWSWRLDGEGHLDWSDNEATFTAPASSGEAQIEVTVRQDRLQASAVATAHFSEELAGREKVSGIPEPEPVSAPNEPWRSRLVGDRWQFNTGHRDYMTASRNERQRLLYLIHLLAKEVVLRNFGGPGEDVLLERMVEVLTHLSEVRAPRIR
jgi:hypothetical protein